MTDRLYRVLRPGVRQLVGDEVRRPPVGSFINVSDAGAVPLIREGFIELAAQAPAAAPAVATSAEENS